MEQEILRWEVRGVKREVEAVNWEVGGVVWEMERVWREVGGVRKQSKDGGGKWDE